MRKGALWTSKKMVLTPRKNAATEAVGWDANERQRQLDIAIANWAIKRWRDAPLEEEK